MVRPRGGDVIHDVTELRTRVARVDDDVIHDVIGHVRYVRVPGSWCRRVKLKEARVR